MKNIIFFTLIMILPYFSFLIELEEEKHHIVVFDINSKCISAPYPQHNVAMKGIMLMYIVDDEALIHYHGVIEVIKNKDKDEYFLINEEKKHLEIIKVKKCR